MTVEQLTETLEEHGRAEYAEAMEAYMKNKFSFYGIKSPQRRLLTKDFLKDAKLLPIDDLVVLVHDLWDYDQRDYQMVAVDILLANKKRFDIGQIEDVERWITKKSWWDTVDMIGSNVVGQIGLSSPDPLLPVLEKWIVNDNIWLNRCCLIFQLKYKEDVDLDRLYKYIHVVNHKKEFFIQKAIGWSLRQASKFYPSEIKSFISEQSLSNLAIREGSKYLD